MEKAGKKSAVVYKLRLDSIFTHTGFPVGPTDTVDVVDTTSTSESVSERGFYPKILWV